MTRKNELPETGGELIRQVKHFIFGLMGTAVLAVVLLFIISEHNLYALPYALQDPISRMRLLPGALIGNTASQIELARTYYPRLTPGGETDRKRLYWFKRAAQNGDSYGAYLVGQAYHWGYGVEKNLGSALGWYGTAAEQGDAWAKARFDYRAAYANQNELMITISTEILENRKPVEMSAEIPGRKFRECPECPEMILIPGVNDRNYLGISKFEITVADYAACLRAGKCWFGRADRPVPYKKNELGPNFPIVGLNLEEIRDYLLWLFESTGKNYRLPTRREWMWAANGGTETDYPWGGDYEQFCLHGNLSILAEGRKTNAELPLCDVRNEALVTVGMFTPNGFGLYDMVGNADEPTTQCGSIECEPNISLGGNYLKPVPYNKDASLLWGSPIPTDNKSGSSTQGLRVIRDFAEPKIGWLRMRRSIFEDERRDRIDFDVEKFGNSRAYSSTEQALLNIVRGIY